MSEELIQYAYVDGSECVSVSDPAYDGREEDLDLRMAAHFGQNEDTDDRD